MMANLNKRFFLHSLNWGLIVAGVLILGQLLIYIFDVSVMNWVFNIFYQLLVVVFMVWMMALASIKFRNKYLEKRIKFTQCLLMGLMIGSVATVVYVLYTYLFNNFYDPDNLVRIKDEFVEMISNNDYIPDEKKEEIIANGVKGFTPMRIVIQSLTSMGIMTVVLSLIATLFVRKKEKVEEVPV